MENRLYNAILYLYNALRSGEMDTVGLSEHNLRRMEAELNLILETQAPLTYCPDEWEVWFGPDGAEVQGWQGYDDHDGQPDELTEWHDFDPDC